LQPKLDTRIFTFGPILDSSHLLNVNAYRNIPPNRNPVTAYLSRLSANSRPTMQTALALAAYVLTGDASRADQLPWHRLRYDDTRMLRFRLAICYAPATVNRVLSAVRSVLRECRTLGYMSADQQIRVSSIPPVPNSWRLEGSDISVSDVFTILHACEKDPRPAGRRDAALLALLYGVGLRSSEIVSLDLDDYSPTTRSLTLRQGNGNVICQQSVSRRIAEMLHYWLLTRGQESGPFVMPISKSGRPQPRRLTTRAIAWILQRRAIAAGMTPFSPGDLRRNGLTDPHAYI
jgi:integrase/recombinase XerD